MASAANFSCFDSNLSSDSLTHSVWSLDPIVQTDTATRYTIAVIITLLLVIGLPSNILVIAVILKKGLLKKQPTVTLLLNLTVTDLLVCILVLPVNILTLFFGEFRFGTDDATRCKVCQTGVIFVTLSFVTLNTLAVTAIDRFVYLKAAIHYYKHVTQTRAIVAILFTWLASIAVTIPPLFGFNEMRFSTAVGICTIAFSGSTHLGKNSHYLILIAIFVMVPIFTLVITNAWGMGIIYRQLRSKSKMLKLERGMHRKSFHKKLRRNNTAMQLKLVKIYSAIFVTNLITYLPMVARIITGVVAEDEEFSPAVRITGSLAYVALLSQAVVHPIVQASLIADVRKEISTQLSNVAEKVRKISRNENGTNSLETVFRKTSRSEVNGSPSQEKSTSGPNSSSEKKVTISATNIITETPPKHDNSILGRTEANTLSMDDSTATHSMEDSIEGSLSSLPQSNGASRSSEGVNGTLKDSTGGERKDSREEKVVLYRGDICCNVFCGCRCWEDIVPEDSQTDSTGTL